MSVLVTSVRNEEAHSRNPQDIAESRVRASLGGGARPGRVGAHPARRARRGGALPAAGARRLRRMFQVGRGEEGSKRDSSNGARGCVKFPSDLPNCSFCRFFRRVSGDHRCEDCNFPLCGGDGENGRNGQKCCGISSWHRRLECALLKVILHSDRQQNQTSQNHAQALFPSPVQGCAKKFLHV